MFYEGLLAFHMARTQQQSHLITRGNEALEVIKMHSQVNPYTFENKYCLLEASRMELLGLDQAGVFYQKAIDSARANKFPHVSDDDFCFNYAVYSTFVDITT